MATNELPEYAGDWRAATAIGTGAISPTESPSNGELVPSPVGHGMIRRGSLPGTNRGGTGRPTNRFAERLRKIRENPEVARELKAAAIDRTDPGWKHALDMLAKYDPQVPQPLKGVPVETVKAKLLATLAVIQESVSRELYGEIADRLRTVWSD